MEKFKKYIETWYSGKQVKGIQNVTLSTIHLCADIYNSIARGEKPQFIDSKVKEILDKCGIKTKETSIGWKII